MPRLLPVTGVRRVGKRDEILLEGGIQVTVYVKGLLEIGSGVQMSPGIEIGMPDKPIENFIVGDQCRLYAGQIAPRNFTCGDYVTIHEGVWAYGKQDITIGHNGWFGRRCTLDAEGGFRVGNGFGAGQDSHMWSHIRHGDTLAGNRWLKYGEFWAGDDVWLTGRCTSAPARHEDRSMAMVEANLTKGMPGDTIWGGNPARDLTDKLGVPVMETTLAQRQIDFDLRVRTFWMERHDVEVNDWAIAALHDAFDVEHRTYRKTGVELEVALMRYLLPEAKFVPEGHERV
jgi:acetyltransferase-like isoleucine patch superfamily enzyme